MSAASLGQNKQPRWSDRVATAVTRAVGSPVACALAILVVLVWAVTGPIFGFSETWQLVINTGTTVVTFIMVFIIQQSQNKDSVALHLKLNELLASHAQASNRLVSIEDFDKEELEVLHRYYLKLARLAEEAEGDLKLNRSLERAGASHRRKKRSAARRPQ